MRKSIVTAALAGTIAVTGAAFAVPALADTTSPAATAPVPVTTTAATTTPAPSATDGSTTTTTSPQARLTEALAGLVTDGTITQAQADEVASTLADRLPRGGHGGGDHDGFGRAAFGQVSAAAAKALGVSETDLRTELQGGKSVADVAEEKGVDLATVTTAVTDAVKAQIAQAVSDGTITQARADAIEANLDAKVAEELAEVHDGHHGGRDGRGGPFGGPDDPGSTTDPSPAAPTS